MSEPLLAHQIVRLKGRLQIMLVYPNTHSHKHVLRSFGHSFVSSAEQVRLLKSFEAEKVVVKISSVVNPLVDRGGVIHNDLEGCLVKQVGFASSGVHEVVKFLCNFTNIVWSAFVQGGDADSVCQHCVVRMHDSHVGTCFSAQICNLAGFDS